MILVGAVPLGSSGILRRPERDGRAGGEPSVMRLSLRAAATGVALLCLLPTGPLLLPARAQPPAAGSTPAGFLRVGPAAGPAGLPQLVDARGRAVLLRGVNVAGLVDYWQPGLRPPYPVDPRAYEHGRCPADDPRVEAPPVCAEDLPQIAALGFSVIRLPVSWSLLEPAPGRIDPTYVARIAQVIGWARAAGVRVVVDLHEDAWSKFVFTPPGTTCPPPTGPIRGYDGAPAWATTHLTPACAVNGTRELDPQVAENAQRLLADAPGPDGVGLQEHVGAVLTALARRFRDDPTVVGYDVLNEPHPGFAPAADDSTELLPFYARVVATVRAGVPGFRQLFFIEPDVTRELLATRTPLLPWSAYSSYRNVVYAPHLYTGVFTVTPGVTPAQDYDAAAADAATLGLPLWVGELGDDPKDDATLLAPAYAEQDRRGLGSTLWLWKENANDVDPNQNWSVYAPPYPTGVPRPARLRIVSRPYPVVLAGRLVSLSVDTVAGRFTLVADSPRVSDWAAATAVFVPTWLTAPVRVTGASARIVRLSGGGRLVLVLPQGGRYTVT